MTSSKNSFKGKLIRDIEFFEREVVLAKDVEIVKLAASNMNADNDRARLVKLDLELEKFVDVSEKQYLIE